MKQLSEYSVADLNRVIAIKEQIDSLHSQLASILGDVSDEGLAEPQSIPRRRKMSTAARRKIARAQRARWAKVKRATETLAGPASQEKRKRRMSAAGRKAIAAAAKARWAKFRAQKA